MSYRTRVNEVQIFGNNEYYSEWIEFIKSQRIEVDDDGCYDGEITDVMGALKTIEKIVMQLEKEYREEKVDKWEDNYITDSESGKLYKSIFNFSYIYDKVVNDEEKKYSNHLTDLLINIKNNSYLFMPLAFLQACGESIKKGEVSRTEGRIYTYSLVEGKKIKVHAG